MLTCACGARFEVDDTLAGQEVLCPECQQPLKAPAAAGPPQVTSAWALASVIVALVGAFTVIGTLAAVVLGVVGLRHVARNRQRVTGAGFAAFGIVLGLVLTPLTLFALTSSEMFGLAGWLRERTASEQVDTSGPLEIVRAAKGFAITRPTEKWGQVAGNRSDDPVVSGLQNNRDLLLMQVARYAFVDVRAQPRNPALNLDEYQDEVLAELERQPAPNLFDDEDEGFRRVVRAQLRGSRRLAAENGVEGRELTIDTRCAGQPWRFLIRLYRRGDGPVYVVRAYAQRRRFDLVADELNRALDSFRVLPGR
jgi:hypothetical protein